MTYRQLLQALSQFSNDQLDMPVIVSVGNDEDEICPVENLQTISGDVDEDFLAGNPYLRIT